MSKKLEAIVGLATLGSTIMTGLTYGVTDAKGGGMPEREYVVPFLLDSGFCLGAKPSCPTDTLDPKVGGVYAGVTAVLWGISYGLGYMVEGITS